LFILSIIPSVSILYVSTIYFSGEKYSISYYHFNTQYLAGSSQAETYIINESLHNILLMYDGHPSWKFNIELSGSGLEAVHDKFPSTYELLVNLTNQGQLELILSPYSEQLSAAYTYEDMRKSLELNERILMEFGLEKSSVLFVQEGQWHPAWVKLKHFGYDTFLVAESTLEYHGIPNLAPVLEYEYLGEKGYLVVYPDPGIRQVGVRKLGDVAYLWRWANDGEVSNTDATSGGGAETFRLNPERMKLHESRLEELEKWGFKFIKISEWVQVVKSKGFMGELNGAQQFIPDSLWQANAISLHLWMGENYYDIENDGYICALNYKVRNKVFATETLFNWYKDGVPVDLQTQIGGNVTQAWKHLLLAEVSDSTGWSPAEVEIRYSVEHANLASEYCDNVIETLRGFFGFTKVQVFTGTGVVTLNISIPELESVSEGKMPNYARVVVEGSQYSVQYYNVSYLNQTYYLAEVTVQPSEEYKVMLGLGADNVYYSPSLAENITQLLPHYPNPIYLPLSNGLIYSGGWAVIKNASQHHTALTVEGGKMYYEEINQLNLVKMSFIIKQCTLQEALVLAGIVNTYPVIILGS